jgi:hypothetical protein
MHNVFETSPCVWQGNMGVKKTRQKRIEIFQLKYLRSILGVKFSNKMKSEDIREHLGLENKAEEMINYQRE